MILTVAEGSTGSYFVDADGRVYTQHSYVVAGPERRGRESAGFVRPGERPDGHRHQQYGGGTTFWLPTGQVEHLNVEQEEILDEARDELDLRYLLIEAREFVLCAECGKPAHRDPRILMDGRVPFVCEDRHLTVDEGEQATAASTGSLS